MKQIENLLRLLNERKVRYLIIGATALAVHGVVRATVDLDLYIASDTANLEKLRAALQEFGYDITDATLDDFKKFKILLRQYDLPLDLHPFVKGAAPFDEVWQRRKIADLGKVKASFVCLEDLIQMKREAGRPQDLADLQKLKKLKPA